MNREHKDLIAKMNRVEELAEKKAGKAVVGRAIQTLASTTVAHFKSEEAFEKGNGDLPDGFISFLHFWLRAHICGVDKKYADHVHSAVA